MVVKKKIKKDSVLKFNTKYIGTGICPKCKKRGAFRAKFTTNTTTKKIYPATFDVQHTKKNKYNSVCYLGTINTLTKKYAKAIEKAGN